MGAHSMATAQNAERRPSSRPRPAPAGTPTTHASMVPPSSTEVARLARNLGVSVPTAGTLTSAFAVGMIAGARLMALLGRRRRPRRQALLVLPGIHVAGAGPRRSRAAARWWGGNM
ncbi:hypothetical protein AB5J72_04805 [Streptomyces sp. CG1]|uniref:hypothetical protein n=1 Tax=Streptomyces sp. CG1 TaxID=1287523 RepID=UPI0034E1B5EB